MPKKTKSFVDLAHPGTLLRIYDEQLKSGLNDLYPWQLQVHKKFAHEPPKGITNELKLVAANDSGKSKMVLAPCLLWHTCQFDKATTVLTSGSGLQLDRQTGKYIKDYARRMNSMHSSDLWTIQHRFLRFEPTHGELIMFATDEATKAEGWHQADFDSALCLAVDESKGVSDEIFQVIDRCHDAQRVLLASSPALGTSGFFYRRCTTRENLLVDRSQRTNDLINIWDTVFKVTAYECDHIPASKIQKTINFYGLHSPITKSIIFAEFSSTDEMTVLNWNQLQKLVSTPALKLGNLNSYPLRVGGDLAAGGDENVLSIWQGNEQVGQVCFRESDTTRTVIRIQEILTSYKINKDSEYLFFDDGGVGKAMIDSLRRAGWNIKRILNQSQAINTDRFGNRGAELWFNFASFVENEELRFLADPQTKEVDEVLIKQLSGRYYKQGQSGKIILESKREAKSKGHPSPDRADAAVLAFTGMKAPMFTGQAIEPKSHNGVLTQDQLIEFMDQLQMANYENRQGNVGNKPVYGSVSSLLNRGSENSRLNVKSRKRLSEHLREQLMLNSKPRT